MNRWNRNQSTNNLVQLLVMFGLVERNEYIWVDVTGFVNRYERARRMKGMWNG
jgi:hypothetical protein